MPPQFTLVKTLQGGRQLQIRGEFQHPHWVAFLSSGLSKLNVSVMGGSASSVAIHDWDACFDLDFSGCTMAPEQIDYLSLSQQETTLAFAPPKLSHYEITRRTDRSLDVVLQGPDQVGFLGRILVKLSLLTLFPSEMEVETVGGRIRDRIVFRGIGGRPPHESVEESLDTMLRGMIASG